MTPFWRNKSLVWWTDETGAEDSVDTIHRKK